MSQTRISEGQSLVDVAVQALGSVAALFDLADAQGLAITDALTAEQVAAVPASAHAAPELAAFFASRAYRVNTGGGAQTLLTLNSSLADPEFAIDELNGGAWQSEPTMLLYNAATASNAAGYYTLRVRSAGNHALTNNRVVGLAETITPDDARYYYSGANEVFPNEYVWSTSTTQFQAAPFFPRYAGGNYSELFVRWAYKGLFELWNRQQPNVATNALTRSDNVRQVIPVGGSVYTRNLGKAYTEPWLPAQGLNTVRVDGNGEVDFFFGYRLQYPAGTVVAN